MVNVYVIAVWLFQYRKRYEVTCDKNGVAVPTNSIEFQYRKRYEVTCDCAVFNFLQELILVSIPQAV